MLRAQLTGTAFCYDAGGSPAKPSMQPASYPFDPLSSNGGLGFSKQTWRTYSMSRQFCCRNIGAYITNEWHRPYHGHTVISSSSSSPRLNFPQVMLSHIHFYLRSSAADGHVRLDSAKLRPRMPRHFLSGRHDGKDEEPTACQNRL